MSKLSKFCIQKWWCNWSKQTKHTNITSAKIRCYSLMRQNIKKHPKNNFPGLKTVFFVAENPVKKSAGFPWDFFWDQRFFFWTSHGYDFLRSPRLRVAFDFSTQRLGGLKFADWWVGWVGSEDGWRYIHVFSVGVLTAIPITSKWDWYIYHYLPTFGGFWW